MAIVQIVAPTTAQTTSASFTLTGPFVLYGEGFSGREVAILEQEVTSGVWVKVTNLDGYVGVGKFPNSAYYGALGTFRINKGATNGSASVSYEVQ